MKRLIFNLLLLFSVASLSSCGYNTMVEKQENVEQQWAQVQNVYQRRLDLIPNLVNTVKGAADFEKSTLTQVIEARAKATSVNVDASKLSPEQIANFQQTQDQLSSALSRLLVSVEQYPQLRANQNFLELQAQLEGTENRISVERRNFNEAVMDYNAYIRKFPQNMIAGMFDFEKKGYFQAAAGAEKAPEVKF
ncbi:MAG: LemA family protein [Sporocytophaga sp.]|uniref:LemA family protein n=1 Tax=Sporocytophaga TaxID=1011 RepID=UPI000427DF17|nr:MULTISPECIES: LemA family protein [Sporocytophaga]MBO9701909.1 LemA family protein [Sporocytophaga sp.]